MAAVEIVREHAEYAMKTENGFLSWNEDGGWLANEETG